MNGSDALQLDVIVGELTLSNGQRQTDAHHLALITPPRRAHADRRPETLLVFLDLGEQGAAGLAGAMLANLEGAYWHCAGPVTTALRQAIAAANDHLREENRLVAVSQRRRAGLVCAVVREDDLYLAQIGPAKAWLASGEQVTKFPQAVRDQLPLGVTSGLDIRYTHSRLNPGDCLLLTGETWAAKIPEPELVEALTDRGASPEEVMQALENLAARSPFSALVMQCSPVEQVPAPAPPRRQQPMPPAVMTPAPAEVDPQWDYAPHLDTPASPDYEHETAGEPEPASVISAVTSIAERFRTTGSTSRSEPVETEHSRPSKPLIDFSLDRERLDRGRQGLQSFALTVGDAARTALMRILPEPEKDAPPRRRQRGPAVENVPVMAGIAVTIPLLVAFVVVTFYLQRGAAEQRDTALAQAQAAVELARQSKGDDAEERWEAAFTAAEEALHAAPEDEEIAALYAEARTTLDALGSISRPGFKLLWNFGTGGAYRLAASRMQVYVLDLQQDQVTQHDFNQTYQSVTGDQFTRIAYRGLQVNDREVGELRDLIWLNADSTAADDVLLMLTTDDHILQHNRAWGLRWISLNTDLPDEQIRAMRPYDGKVYLLDTAQNQIWRFPTTAEGFGPAEHYFRLPPPDLSDAVDMAIDGAVYVLLKDGSILKFFGGDLQTFEVSGLPQPLIEPVSLVSEGDVDEGALYVADAGSRSVIVLNKKGEFVHQIQAQDDTLAGLEDIAIEQNNRTLYIIANGQLYAFELPPLSEMSGDTQ
jgi:hypothetical protein